jgi:hypothetical protein
VKRLLADTGPLVALLDADDAAHSLCAEAARRERTKLVSTWPVITEAMYMLQAAPAAQSRLLAWVEDGRLNMMEIDDLVGRIRVLLEKYADLPMDFADATLVAVAERERLDRIFTLDDDFRVYRIGGRRAFQIVP